MRLLLLLGVNVYCCVCVAAVPSPPGKAQPRDVQTRQVTISWAASETDNNSPISDYIVEIRYQMWANGLGYDFFRLLDRCHELFLGNNHNKTVPCPELHC